MPSFVTMTAAMLVALMAAPATAHTWIEEMQMIDSNGSYFGPSGFSRGYMARTDPGFNGESNLWLLPALEARNPDSTTRNHINGSDLLCHPSQRTSNYTTYPKLKATAGGYVAMKYLENGHVTLPWTLQGKPENGGSVLIYGTTKPSPEEKIVDVMQWTKDGSGGDGRGFLMGEMDYDDGECHQLNTCWVSAERQILFPNNIPQQGDAQAERWCESDIKIPEKVQPGQLTVYWIWDWGTKAGQDCQAPDGKDQYYTNCADIDIIADDGSLAAGNAKIAAEGNKQMLEQVDPNTRAVKNFASRTAVNSFAMTTAANWANYNKVAAAASSGAANSSWLAFCQTSILSAQQAVAANPAALPASCPPGSYAPTGAEYTAWAASVKAKATNMPADSPAAATSAPAPTQPPATSAPAAAPSSAPAPTSAPAAPAPSQAAGSAPAGEVVTVNKTQFSVSTLTTYVATSPAPATSAAPAPAESAPAAPAPAPADPAAADAAAGETAADGMPTVSVISDPSAGPTGAPAGPPGGAPPYNAAGRPGGMGEEYQHRRHPRHFGGRMG